MARDIATTGTWRCVITDSTHDTRNGVGKSTHTPTYAPSDPLRRFLRLRDQRCRFPDCTRPTQNTDTDHLQRHPDGDTCECNTHLLCRHHHRLKHETGFSVKFSTDPEEPPGTVVWTTPGRREYIDRPDPLDSSALEYPSTSKRPPPSAETTDAGGTGSKASSSQADLGPPPF